MAWIDYYKQVEEQLAMLLSGTTEAGVAIPGVPVAGKDNGPNWTSSYTFTTSADATAGADVTAAPTTGQKIVVTDLVVAVDTAMSVSFLEETSGTEVLRLYLAANSAVQVTPRGKLKLATANKKLRVDTSVAGNIAVTALYYSEA